MNKENEIKQLKQDIEKLKQKKNQAEWERANLEERKQEILNKLNELEVDPKNLAEEIAKREKEIDDLLAKAKSLMPFELLKNE